MNDRLRHVSTYMPNFELYEQLKSKWVFEHPHSTPAEYQNAMREIAERCGI